MTIAGDSQALPDLTDRLAQATVQLVANAGDALFREVTLRICGDLDPSAALGRAFEALRAAIPATAASLHVFERDLGAVRTVAAAPAGEGAGGERLPVFMEAVLPFATAHVELTKIH